MKKIPSLILALALIIFSCTENEEPAPPLPMSVTNQEAEVLPDGSVKLTGKIVNFEASRVGECGFYLENASGFNRRVSIPSSDTETFSITVEGLAPLTNFTFRSYFREIRPGGFLSSIEATTAKSFVTGFPNLTFVPPQSKVSDFSVITVMGSKLSPADGVYFYFGSKSSSTANIVYKPLNLKSITADKYEGYIPPVGASGKTTPPLFEGVIQPCAIYVGNQSKSQIQKIGDIDYTYLFSLPVKTGKPGDALTVIIFYARQASLDNVEVYFDQTKLVINEKTYVSDIEQGGNLIEGYRLSMQVPAGASSGSHTIKVLSPFGEEFIAGSSGNVFVVD